LLLIETSITDAGLVNLTQMPRLEELFLNVTPVGNEGMENLKGLVRLRVLDLSGTNVTNAKVSELQHALPNCYIEH
jgi:hypothetical protein